MNPDSALGGKCITGAYPSVSRPHSDQHRRDLISPEILKPRWRQRGVPHRVLDVAVSQIGLERPGVVALVGQRVGAGVSQHVRGRIECKPRVGACPLHQSGKPSSGKGRSSLRREDEWRLGLLLALQPPQSPQLG